MPVGGQQVGQQRWAQIHALEAAGQPLPADLAAFKATSVAAKWEQIHALEAAGQPLPVHITCRTDVRTS